MLTFVTIALVVAALYFAREVLVPFAVAVLLSFMLAPAVRLLRRLHAGRMTAVAIVVLVAFVAIIGFGAIVAAETAQLGPQLPQYQSNIESKLAALPKALPLDRIAGAWRQLTAALRRSQTTASPSAGASGAGIEAVKPLPVEIEQPGLTPLQIAETVIGPLLQPLAMTGLVIVLVVFILLEREELRDRMLRLVGGGDLHRSTEAMNEAAQRVSRYLLSQLAVNAVEGTLLAIGLAIIGIPNAALWGIMVLVLRFIPYLGIVIAAAFPIALAIAVAPGWSLALWTVLLFIGIETIIANAIEPRVYAGSTGLSSLAVIVAAVFWTWLWGPIGLLLSTPLSACLLVLGRHVPQLGFLEILLGSEPVLSADETFYQRLLAGDPEEAAEQAEEFATERSLADFAEEVALLVLARAQADSDRGILAPERRENLKAGFARILESLFDDPAVGADDAIENAPAPAPPPGFIACIAGRNELDEAAAMLLASLLRARGRPACVFAPEALAGSGGLALREAGLVCLVLVSTSSPARARHIVRRVRRRAPRARIVVGFWGLRGEEALAGDAVAMTTADAVVTTLVGALAETGAAATPASPAPRSSSENARAQAG